ncbi:hypothetical protein I8751_16435 [Nostocaceae cyanobacterium CENA357]|uniref:Uncharacterized protein n=1 Tax=Atlanticothrix silvestris CENA357 TaxID=1725252 RepID=A0A8J7HK87_9CYAN|nr:hypothetical protein [Atlanticothrix silvestris CENA357]MBH8553930.1 hypothetical protein [Atlanticothrix silvestris CENA357]
MAVPVDCEPPNLKGGSHATCSTWGNPKTAVAPRCSKCRRLCRLEGSAADL